MPGLGLIPFLISHTGLRPPLPLYNENTVKFHINIYMSNKITYKSIDYGIIKSIQSNYNMPGSIPITILNYRELHPVLAHSGVEKDSCMHKNFIFTTLVATCLVYCCVLIPLQLF